MEVTLNNGNKMPIVGLGTWQLTDRTELLKVLESAYEVGYRHIDTASFYGNEKIIGEFLKKHKRDEFFITTKLWNDDHDDVLGAVDRSLKKLGIDCLDLYLVHWPVNFCGEFDLKNLWRQMEKVVELKKAKSIGISNFGIKNMTELLSFCKIKPVANQIELHPYLPQNEIRSFCDKNNIQVISYSTLGSSSGGKYVLKNDPVINEIAKNHNVAAPKVILSFYIDQKVAVIPRSRSKEHLKDNITPIELTAEEKNKIKNIKIRYRYVDPVDFGLARFD